MSSSGEALGVELGVIYKYGRETLPKLAEEFATTASQTPASVSQITRRGGDLGHDPGPDLDAMVNLLLKATNYTSAVLTDLSQRLVYLADDYKNTDAQAHQVFEQKKAEVDTEVLVNLVEQVVAAAAGQQPPAAS